MLHSSNPLQPLKPCNRLPLCPAAQGFLRLQDRVQVHLQPGAYGLHTGEVANRLATAPAIAHTVVL